MERTWATSYGSHELGDVSDTGICNIRINGPVCPHTMSMNTHGGALQVLTSLNHLGRERLLVRHDCDAA